MKKKLLFLFLSLSIFSTIFSQKKQSIHRFNIQKEALQKGWNTWNSENIMEQVLLPMGLQVSWALKKVQAFDEPILEQCIFGESLPNSPNIRLGIHSLNGQYTNFELEWEGLKLQVQYASSGNQLVMKIHPLASNNKFELITEVGFMTKPKKISYQQDKHISVTNSQQKIDIFCTGEEINDPFTPNYNPHFVKKLNQDIYIFAGDSLSTAQADLFIQEQLDQFEIKAQNRGDQADLYRAVISGIAWNIIYDAKNDRIIPTVGRLWNKEYGGYCLFGWDNFFLAYMIGLENKELAQIACIEHLNGLTSAGFIPNDNAGNGRKSWDRSQPPVGGIMTRAIYYAKPEKWFLDICFPKLLAWNTWYFEHRMNEGLLAYGSSPAKNPFHESARENMQAAKYESGMDDSPMYSNIKFNHTKYCMDLQDVGLNSLYIADCYALADMAEDLGLSKEKRVLIQRAKFIEKGLEKRWDNKLAYFLNYNTLSREDSKQLSPTLFYPLLTPIVSAKQKREMAAHLRDTLAFGGKYVIPSVDRSNPIFHKQRYWKGAIWPPLNFLVYLGLKQAGMNETAKDISEKSARLFLKEWKRKAYVSENYSSISGTGDDPHLSSDRFHSWGALMGIIPLIESNKIPYPLLKYK